MLEDIQELSVLDRIAAPLQGKVKSVGSASWPGFAPGFSSDSWPGLIESLSARQRPSFEIACTGNFLTRLVKSSP